MAYFGKEFAFEKEENYDEFITSLGLDASDAQKWSAFKVNQKIEKDGDNYKLVYVTPKGNKEISFTPGETFDENVDGQEAKSTFTVDGDTITQVQDFGDIGTLTYKREYSADQLKLTITSSKWDGAATRWYNAV